MVKRIARVTAKCLQCGHRRDIEPGEVAPDDMPVCDRCFSFMIAERAKTEA